MDFTYSEQLTNLNNLNNFNNKSFVFLDHEYLSEDLCALWHRLDNKMQFFIALFPFLPSFADMTHYHTKPVIRTRIILLSFVLSNLLDLVLSFKLVWFLCCPAVLDFVLSIQQKNDPRLGKFDSVMILGHHGASRQRCRAQSQVWSPGRRTYRADVLEQRLSTI